MHEKVDKMRQNRRGRARGEKRSVVQRIRARKKFLRCCVNYRHRVVVTGRDCYRIARADECIDLLGETRVDSTFDTNHGYWQVKMDDKLTDKTRF